MVIGETDDFFAGLWSRYNLNEPVVVIVKKAGKILSGLFIYLE